MLSRCRLLIVGSVLLCVLASATPALALPRLSTQRTRELATLVNRFVNDVVRRKDLSDGWRLAGPDLTGGTTRARWESGRGVTVEQFSPRGTNFRKSWYANWTSPGEIGFTLNLRTGRGANAKMIDEEGLFVRRHGRWLVDELYPDAIIRLGHGHRGSCAGAKCAVSGPYDYSPSGGGGGGGGGGGSVTLPQIQKYWIWVFFGAIAIVPVAFLVGAVLFVRRRDRRARAAYLASRSP